MQNNEGTQVQIDEVVSRVCAIDGGAALAPETLQKIISAVLQAVELNERRRQNIAEELSLRNYQQRNHPWED